MPDTTMSLASDLLRLRNEFVSMPGLGLDVRQAARLLAVPEIEARGLLETLVDEGILVHSVAGMYRRVPCPTTIMQPAI